MLGQRVLTALVLLALLLPTIFLLPAWTWAALTLVFLTVAMHEWAGLLPAGGGGDSATSGGRGSAAGAGSDTATDAGSAGRAIAVAGAVLVIGLALLGLRLSAGWPSWFALVVSLAATAWWCLAAPLRLRQHTARAGGWPLAAALLLACWVALVELHALGPAALLAALAVVWIADIAAYFVGRAIGRRKLAPAISPGKSWEGAIGGALAVALAAAALGLLAQGSEFDAQAIAQTLPVQLFAALPAVLAAGLFIALAALSVVGDLHESLLKRQAGAKDSGTLLPGHGGVLDRIDALLPVMPAVLLLHRLFA